MTLNEVLVQLTTANAWMLHAAVSDVPADRFTFQPPALPNHPAWTLGHLTYIRTSTALMLGAPGPVPVDQRFVQGSTPVADLAAYPPKSDLLAAFDAAEAHFQSLLAALTPAQLTAPTPDPDLLQYFPTVQDMLLGELSLHDGLHIGQLTDWRRATGLPRLLG